ncbi:uncharacterized protein LOC124956188 [Vespa velutina]|uniref:uncharacterized protein LOC124956188 n=1 Tax=Vespa velutina TaxID=202808 RepID=UPI001FB51688|nr:uncharacterized protein LOC124956188 [Vespa velutina]XP_047367615.1 uncharacterized protein LOC124956188 [Vespa velutina]XP_047367616.1 uncharacterized protein LOC124956188 [Vespa velutina]XP_047367618.1 uncharacterized protein LOC124956188 [Vespa velutina]
MFQNCQTVDDQKSARSIKWICFLFKFPRLLTFWKSVKVACCTFIDRTMFKLVFRDGTLTEKEANERNKGVLHCAVDWTGIWKLCVTRVCFFILILIYILPGNN